MTSRPVERKVQVPTRLPMGMAGLGALHQALLSLAEAHNYHDDALNKAFKGGISNANNSLSKLKTVRVQMPADAPFILFDMNGGSGWVNYGAGFYEAAYLMEPGGHVSMRGLVNGGTPDYVSDGLLGTLPTGYAPGQQIGFASEGGNGAYAIARVSAAGEVIFAYSASGSPYLFLEPLHWIAPNAAPPHPFVGATWPMVIHHGFTKCKGLLVEGCRRSGSAPSGTVGAPVADWEDIGGGKLRINGMWGLQWGSAYDVRLRLSAEDDD